MSWSRCSTAEKKPTYTGRRKREGTNEQAKKEKKGVPDDVSRGGNSHLVRGFTLSNTAARSRGKSIALDFGSSPLASLLPVEGTGSTQEPWMKMIGKWQGFNHLQYDNNLWCGL
jgi:hypothetical protein